MFKLRQVPFLQAQSNHPFLDYIHKFTEISQKVKKLTQLNDGVYLCELFKLINKFGLCGYVEQFPVTFSHRFSNLKVLLKSIENYWNHHLNREIDILEEIDLIDVAKNGKDEEIEKLIQLFIKTAVSSTNNEYFIEKIMQTTEQTKVYLKNILEQNSKKLESPRKEKQKRLYDHLVEIDHQNEKLQEVIGQICQDKQEIQLKNKTLLEKLEQKEREIERLNLLMRQTDITPRKNRIVDIPDTNEKNEAYIETLKQQIYDMASQHEKQLQHLTNQIIVREEKDNKTESAIKALKDQHQNLKLYLGESKGVQKLNSKLKTDIIEKDNVVQLLQDKLEKWRNKSLQMEKKVVELQVELERKNVKIQDLSNKNIFSPSADKTLREALSDNINNLFDECPEIIDKNNEALIQNNKTLRNELERTTIKLKETEEQLNRKKKQAGRVSGLQVQNKKLMEYVADLCSHRGEENDILVGCLSEMRKLFLHKRMKDFSLSSKSKDKQNVLI